MARAIIQKKKSGAWWKCLIAFFLGIIFTIGLLAGGVFVVGGVLTTKDIIKMAGQDPDLILNAEYQDKTIIGIITDAIGGKIEVKTLGDISDITPLIDDFTDDFLNSLSDFGIDLSQEELYSWEFKDFPTKIQDTVENIQIIKFFQNDGEEVEPILKYFFNKTDDTGEYIYDSESNLIPCTIKDIVSDSDFIGNKIDNLKIKMIFSEADINSSDFLKEIKDKSLSDFSDPHGFDDIKIASILPDSDSKLIKAFARDEVTIGNISSAIDNLYLDDVFDYDNLSDLPPFLKKMIGKDELTPFPGNLISSNPVDLTKMVIDGSGTPTDFDYVIFSDGTEENKTDYIPFSKIEKVGGVDVETGFLDKSSIAIDDDLNVTFSGNEPRDINTKIVTINVYKPSSWSSIYAYSCNKPVKVKDLGGAIDSLKMKDVMTIKETDALWKVRNEPINNGGDLFDSIINNLYIEDILPSYADNKILKTIPGTTKIGDIGDEINNIKLIDIFDDNIFDDSGNLVNTWKYLLI